MSYLTGLIINLLIVGALAIDVVLHIINGEVMWAHLAGFGIVVSGGMAFICYAMVSMQLEDIERKARREEGR